ncbi:carbohydrate-binding family 9-like protein [Paenibacillus apiarius]|uniref:Carbohydrate-binding family 9-like protein n=1 Tax=Paenibacillus apiarius TaxID=46240 RepID=A0ABT4DS15_9BACL|nr:carbohydrate-binding family 9-like protein [Paenibacillus apiarius]MCY9514269.1 carbohydrate-binding family 9-like protein [Paenibacillus apiarius]MCY9520148.1 carbohydrate-binding family 9-like protein [Paenibacillus apiarius]MCY9550155.1 carbohydrate-binding family 9-like protein [Paenibacillus apiarius]MCY9560234.1 carbohydrate-binding family 9-like protein [Paenibacillus apiarius]MCY9683132.1 carbohydrate-binding family 9-like protein [Paenibacillus apiarius]
MDRSGVPEPITAFMPKHYVCLRAAEALELDGRLDKPFWEKAPWTDDFVDIEGDLKPLPNKRTRVKMLWDDEYLYFGAAMEEDQIWATLTERDSVIFYDNDFEIFIDPDGDTHNYYEFEMNAFNTIWDLLLPKPYRDGGPPINSWDIRGIKTAVHIDGEVNNPDADNRGWSVEVAMPWSVLKECAPEGRKPHHGEYWRINFSRVEWKTEVKDGKYVKTVNPETNTPYPEDNWVWSPQGIINMHYPELWGFVQFANEPMEFEMPKDELIKWELRKLYYRERQHYAAHGCYCNDFAVLKHDDAWGIDPIIETTGGLFQISARSHDGQGWIRIRDDGKVWSE